MFAVVALGYIIEIAEAVYHDGELAKKAGDLRDEIENGINTYGIYEHPVYGKIYAYETDGFGNYRLMDDANVPSLLSIPYMGYRKSDDEIYQNTRRFVLSEDNPYYYKGRYAWGIGSPHTPKGNIWPISLTMQALTSNDCCEIEELIDMLVSTDNGTGFMHESFNPDDPGDFTREWFAWANSLFAELLYDILLKEND
jgi:meiotically up-regulated gene 157 (Mug157) protein